MDRQRRKHETAAAPDRSSGGAGAAPDPTLGTGIQKTRSPAWHRAMTGARRQAMELLERLGPSADHLPEEDRKRAHAKLVGELEHVVEVIDQHLREARGGGGRRRKSGTAATGAARAANRPE